jgi:hypothetical protein
MRRAAALVVALLALTLSISVATGDGNADAKFRKERGAAIDKGVAWLKKAQAPDGSWDDDYKPFGFGVHLKQGTTALAALALLKAGVGPDEPCINAAFDFIHTCNLEHVYSVGCVLMALEARYNWEPPHADEPEEEPGEGTRIKKANPKAAPKKIKPAARDIDLAQRCVDYLAKNQGTFGWTYPPAINGYKEDVSNTQYALLGLDAAERLGVNVPREMYEKAQELFVTNQEKDGPEVTPFAVPGADLSYKELKKIEKETRDRIKQIEVAFKGKKPGETNADGHTEQDERRTTDEDAARKIYKTTGAKIKMHSRGWGYAWNKVPGAPGGAPEDRATGSMTTAGLACLFICKAHLDGTKVYEKSLRGPMDHSIRDGAAWVAQHFSVRDNPNMGMHVLYYLYGLERAGVLLLVPKFGEHDWYDEGAHRLVKDQNADGSWHAGMQGTVGPMCDTCFALLFLARGTTPIVRIPTKTATGQGGPAAPRPAEPGETPKPDEKKDD